MTTNNCNPNILRNKGNQTANRIQHEKRFS